VDEEKKLMIVTKTNHRHKILMTEKEKQKEKNQMMMKRRVMGMMMPKLSKLMRCNLMRSILNI